MSPGKVTFTATYSGKTTKYTLNVKKKVIFEVGASQSTRLLYSLDTCKGSNVKFSTADKSLIHVNNGGTRMEWQYATSYTKGGVKLKSSQLARNIVKKEMDSYSSVKNYVEFYIYYLLVGNSIASYSCDTIGTYQDTVTKHISGYNDVVNYYNNFFHDNNPFITL